MHRGEEDYIKYIYKLTIEANKNIVKNNILSELLGYTNQSVNEMVKRLVKKELVEFIPYKGVRLTQNGIVEAKRLVRNHSLWEVFLVNKLGYSWEEVHVEAEKLEHAGSNELIERLFNYLGKPNYCVHGNAIPKLDGNMPKTYNLSLNNVNVGDVFIVKRVLDHPKLLKFLKQINLELHKSIKIINKDEVNGLISVLIDNKLFDIKSIDGEKIYGIIN